MPPPLIVTPPPVASVPPPTAPPRPREVTAPPPPPTPVAPAPEETISPKPVPAPAPPRADLALNSFRKAANRVKIDKDARAVSGCRNVADLTVSNSGSGVYEVAGHNFYYGNADELIRLKTAEAGGDRFVVTSKSKTEISGEAYRCGK
jgi:hypothetical protein